MTETPSQKDVVALLIDQHRRIRELFASFTDAFTDAVTDAFTGAVTDAADEDRQERFDQLRRLLAVHETAEEMVVHPRVRLGEGGNGVVDARLAEEHLAKELLSDLDHMKVTDAGFDAKFAELRTMVLAHADNEEAEEFPLLLTDTDERTRATMASAVLAAEAIAPTHPHPGVESATANFMLGPVASLVDRTRDAVRAVLDRQ